MGGGEALQIAQSYHGWWQLAGIDALVGEDPADWLSHTPAKSLAAANPPSLQPVAAPAETLSMPDRPVSRAVAASGPAAMPAEWDAFQSWLAVEAGVPGSQWDQRRVLPIGAADAPLMVFTACPEVDEQSSGELFVGQTGQLLDAMLHAIGLNRADCYCAALATTRPPGGRFDGETRSALTALLWHHLALARPHGLLLLGNEITAMVTDSDVAAARGNLLNINQEGVTMPVVAVLHPALLLARPALKIAAWDSLKLLSKGR